MFITPSIDLCGTYQVFNGFEMEYCVEFKPKKLTKYDSKCCH